MEYTTNLAVETTDVLVIGGGPAGLCAAIASARTGAKTMLIEQNGYAGGMATAGLVAPFMTCYDSGGGTMLIRGLFEEIVNRLVEMGGAIHPSKVPTSSAFTSYITVGHIHVTPCRAEALKLLADRMLAEAGVTVLYHTMAGGIRFTENGAVITLCTREGLHDVQAARVIDCTGDAVIA